MSQVFQDNKVVPVTLIQAGPCQVVQIKDQEKDGYQAVQVGFEPKGRKFRFLREFRFDGEHSFKVGDQLMVDLFSPGDKVRVVGRSKGRGFQGVVKRWGFAGRNTSHGGYGQVRTLGSVGSRFPQRVVKGRKMPGQMGCQRTTVSNLEVVEIDRDNNLLAVKGAVPGPKKSLLMIIAK